MCSLPCWASSCPHSFLSALSPSTTDSRATSWAASLVFSCRSASSTWSFLWLSSTWVSRLWILVCNARKYYSYVMWGQCGNTRYRVAGKHFVGTKCPWCLPWTRKFARRMHFILDTYFLLERSPLANSSRLNRCLVCWHKAIPSLTTGQPNIISWSLIYNAKGIFKSCKFLDRSHPFDWEKGEAFTFSRFSLISRLAGNPVLG